jgi:uncharacterized damage-inducible protein DinB
MNAAITRLIDHMNWADDQVLAALRAVTPPSEALRWYAHVVAVERVWYLRLEGEDWKVQPVWPEMSLDECAALAGRNQTQVKAIVARTSDAELARRVTYVNSAGRTFTNTAADILIHVALHGVHHRGQVAAALRRAGTAPPVLDYIHFARETAPDPGRKA